MSKERLRICHSVLTVMNHHSDAQQNKLGQFESSDKVFLKNKNWRGTGLIKVQQPAEQEQIQQMIYA